MGQLAALLLVVGGVFPLVLGGSWFVAAIGLLAIAIGLTLVVVLSFRQSRQSSVSVPRAFGRAMKDSVHALWELVP